MDEGTASGRRRRRGPIELVGLLLAAVLVITVLPEPVDAAAPPLPVAQSSTSSAGSCQANGTSYTQMLADRRGFYSLPPWADGAGWANPGSYRTITSGDVDGDGNGELLGRSSSTIEVYTWAPALPAPAIGTSAYSPVPAQWTKVIPTGGSPVDFGDLTGWWDPSRYRTIQLGRLTGRSGTAGPAMDLVYRTATGLEVRTWSSSSSSWNDPITQNLNGGGQVWSDANAMGRSYPQRYLTITTGDVTGDQTDEIIGVGPSGTVEVWGYDGSGLRRLDNGTGPLAPGGWDPATWGASTYRTVRLADIDGKTGDELVARDPNLGLRAFSFTGGAWTELPGQGTNNWNDAEGWGNEVAYENITTGDLDGNGAQDLVGRSGQGAEAWTWNGTAWTQMAPRNDYNYDEGFYDQYPQYWATFQVGSVLEPGTGDPLLPGSEQILIKGGSGVGAEYLVPDPDGPYPYQWQGSAANAYAFADGYGWQPPGTPVDDQGLDPDGTDDLYYGTIDAVTVEAGQPQVVIGRNISGIWTTSMYANANAGAAGPLSGHSPSAPFAAYSDLSAVGNVVKPPQGTNVDLSVLSVEGRSYWGFNNAIAIDNWSQQVETWTLLDQFSTAAGALPNPQDLRPYYTTQTNPDGTSSQVEQAPQIQPNGGYQALNVDRDTYVSVGNDLANWTQMVDNLRNDIYGGNGLKQYVLDTFVANAGSINDIVQAFESSGVFRTALSDLLWGIIGGLLPVVGVFFFPELSATAGAFLALDSSIIGSGVAAIMSVSDPNAGAEGKASELQQEVINTFCSVNDNFDANYQQIVGDYGLLVANDRMIELSESGATSYDTATDTAIAGFKQWVWQQFAGQDPSKNVQNWWVGYCTDGSSGCPWGPNDVGVWTAPENSNVTFRLVGQHKNGSEANCSWGAQNEIVNDTDKGQDPKDAWGDAFVAQPGNAGVGPPGAAFASPRLTDSGELGQPVGSSGDWGTSGVLGWDLGTAKCN